MNKLLCNHFGNYSLKQITPWVMLVLSSILLIIVSPLSLMNQTKVGDWTEQKSIDRMFFGLNKVGCLDNLTRNFQLANKTIDIAISAPDDDFSYSQLFSNLSSLKPAVKIRIYTDMPKSSIPSNLNYIPFNHSGYKFKANFFIIDSSHVYFFGGYSFPKKTSNKEGAFCYLYEVENHILLTKDMESIFNFLTLNKEHFTNKVIQRRYLTNMDNSSKYKLLLQPFDIFPLGRNNFSEAFSDIAFTNKERAIITGSLLQDNYDSFDHARKAAIVFALLEQTHNNDRITRLVITSQEYEKYEKYYSNMSTELARLKYYYCNLPIGWTTIQSVFSFAYLPMNLVDIFDPKVISVGIEGKLNFLSTFYGLHADLENICKQFKKE